MYYRLTTGLNDVGNFINVEDNPYNYITQDKDAYLSVYAYNEEQKKQAEETIEIEESGKKYTRKRGVSGIKDVLTPKLVFDTDHKTDLNVARKDMLTIVDRLIQNGFKLEDIHLSFSGGKGFSAVVYHNKLMTPDQHKSIAQKIAGDLETFDTTVYNASRIFRLDYTKHNSSGLFKTPLTYNQLSKLQIETIKNEAVNKKKPKYNPSYVEFPTQLFMEKKETKVEKTKAIVTTGIDFSKKPYYLSDVKFILHKGYIPPGFGNEGMMVLCATYKNAGFDKTDAYHMLKGVNEKRSEIYGCEKRDNNEIWHQVVEYVYGPLWKGGTYSPKENDLLLEIQETFGIVEDDVKGKKAVTLNEVTGIFKDFAENIDKNTIKIGIPELDSKLRITTSMLVTLLAPPAAGKSSVTFGILNTISNNNTDGIFFSMDMGAPLVYTRLIQRHLGIDSDTIFKYYQDNSEKVKEIETSLAEEYKNIKFCFKSGITVDDIRTIIKEERQAGKNPKFIALDYLECISSQFSDSTASKAYIAQQLKDIANEMGICVFLLVQPQKHAGDPSVELTTYRSIKGSSVIEEAASLILSISRPGFSPKTPQKDKFLSINVLKNRMGQLGSFDFGWDGLRGHIFGLDREQKEELKQLREDLKSQQQENDSW